MIRQATIIELIKSYQNKVKEAVELLNTKLKREPDFHVIDLDNVSSFPQQKYLDIEKTINYEFHGMGCLVKWSNKEMIDFNFGRDGRCDGFDPWFVYNHYEGIRNKNVDPIILSGYDMANEFKAMQINLLVVYDNLFNLYYFEEEYKNSPIVKWMGNR